MNLGVPVLARNIPGNSAVIEHRESGLLFDTPEVSHIKHFRCGLNCGLGVLISPCFGCGNIF